MAPPVLNNSMLNDNDNWGHIISEVQTIREATATIMVNTSADIFEHVWSITSHSLPVALDYNATESSSSSSLSTMGNSTDISYSSSSSSTGSKGMPLIGQALWTLMFSLMLVVAIGGNAIVMWIVVAHRRMRTVTNYFLVNLSIADLLMSTLNCIFNFIYMLRSDWMFGERYCTINNFIANLTVAASVFTLTGISFDRYLAIVRPLQPRMSKKCALMTIASIWIAGIFLATPCLIYSKTLTYDHRGNLQTACILVWPDGAPNESKMDFIYEVVIFVVTYFLPMIGMSRCYLAMGMELWGSRSIGEFTQRQAESIRSKRKVVRMFAVIVSIFAVCWLPYQMYFIYMHIDSSLLYWKYTQHMFLSFYWLAMSNAMVNPLIYYWMNTKFRGYFKQAVCGWRVCFKRRRNEQTGSPPVAGHTHSYSHSRSGTYSVQSTQESICFTTSEVFRENITKQIYSEEQLAGENRESYKKQSQSLLVTPNKLDTTLHRGSSRSSRINLEVNHRHRQKQLLLNQQTQL